MSTQRRLLLSGDRASFTVVVLDLTTNKLRIEANYPAPHNASWVELTSSHGDVDRLIGISEGDKSGLVYTLEMDHAKKACDMTSQQVTLGAPAHFITLRDKSALALATYLGGSLALYPISITQDDGLLLSSAPRTEVLPQHPYKFTTGGHGPDATRQHQCHVHQVIEDQQGLLYAPDLGSDRVWIFARDGLGLKERGWLQCPPGTGPRHAVLGRGESIMYVLGELSHTITAYDLAQVRGVSTEGPVSEPAVVSPMADFLPNIIPPTVHPDYHALLDSAELCLHPTIPNVLYASNRWERHIAARQPHLAHTVDEVRPPGDAVAILLLSEDGRSVRRIKLVRTNVDTIRGMRVSDDGAMVVVCGQEGGGVELYAIGGSRGDEWARVAGLGEGEGLEGGIKHAVWL